MRKEEKVKITYHPKVTERILECLDGLPYVDADFALRAALVRLQERAVVMPPKEQKETPPERGADRKRLCQPQR